MKLGQPTFSQKNKIFFSLEKILGISPLHQSTVSLYCAMFKGVRGPILKTAFDLHNDLEAKCILKLKFAKNYCNLQIITYKKNQLFRNCILYSHS